MVELLSRVLIIDDDPTFRDLLSGHVVKMGHLVETAPSLSEGLDMVTTFKPELVFLDVNLPDGNGLQAISGIRNSPNQPEVIIVTAEGEKDSAVLAIRNGAWDYLQKGRSLDVIVIPLKNALEYRKERLLKERTRSLDRRGILGESTAIKKCLDIVAEAAGDDGNVLISGETGTGKELFAEAIHANSRRKGGSFVIVDCAAMPENLVESLLFGHKKGSFTGADSDKTGLIYHANGGTLFLDEVGEMPLSIQKVFLRVLQERKFRPVGSDRETMSDFRLVAATNRNLDNDVEERKFRKDLLFRLRTHSIVLPPLRERGEDTMLIARNFIENECRRRGIPQKIFSEDFEACIAAYDWPGNVRELIHVMEKALSTGNDYKKLYPTHLPPQVRAQAIRETIEDKYNVPLYSQNFLN